MGDILGFLSSEAGQMFAQNIIAVIALVIAGRSVGDWNQERRDIRRAELAEKALAAAYHTTDVIGFVRSPLGHVEEGATRKRRDGEDEQTAQALDSAFTPIERLNSVSEVFDEIQTLRYSIRAAFGAEAASPLDVFLHVRGQIIAAAHSKMREATRRGEMNQTAIDRAERNDEVIWQGYGDVDKIAESLATATQQLETTFRPFVEATYKAKAKRLFRCPWA